MSRFIPRLLCGGLVVVLLSTGLAAPAAAATGTATCSYGPTTWRVSWSTRSTVYGELLKPTAFHKRVGTGSWTSQASATWAMRWDNTPAEWGNPFVLAHREVVGTLSTLAGTEAAVYLSPRFVVPDGTCQIFVFPFSGNSAHPKIGVVGDSLTQSLNDPTYNQTFLQGYVQGNLAANGRRAEVEGQGGRRWTPAELTVGLPMADSALLDELRGLRSHGPRGFVVALGANDAGWVASGSTEAERNRRLTYVTSQLTSIVNEMGTWGVCTVAVTAPQSLADYWGVSNPWLYAWAAQQINNWVRWVTSVSSTDWFKLQDFGAASDSHHTWHVDNWFQSDNLHLNTVGKLHYTAAITNAALQC